MKLSFKKHPKETGLSSIGNPNPFVDIKGDKKKVGWIQPANWHKEHFEVWLHVKYEEGWRNVKLKFSGDSEQEARKFIKDNWEGILKNFELHQWED